MKRLITFLSLVILVQVSFGQLSGIKNIPGYYPTPAVAITGLNNDCPVINSYPYTEGFEGAWPPICWSDPEQADYGWDKSLFGIPAHTGTEYAYSNLQDAELITPEFVLSSDSRLIFWFRAEDPFYPQDMAVKIGNEVIYQITGAINTEYEIVWISLAAYAGQTVSISFISETGTGGYDYGISLDDFIVRSDHNTWTGDVSNDWDNSGNWDTGFVPDQYDIVYIPASTTSGRFPIVENGQTVECGDLIILNGGAVTVETGGKIEVKNPAL